MVLKVKNLRLTSEGQDSLPGITFELKRGEIVAVFGPSGSGKSLLLHAIAHLPDWITGEIESREFSLMPLLPTPRFGRVSTPARFLKSRADSWARAIYLLELFGLSSKAQEPIRSLSEGEQAALRVAAALAATAPLYLLDDPFALLDFERRKRLWYEMEERARFGAAILFTTREPELAAKADRVLMLHEKQLIADAAPEQLLREVAPALVEVETDDPDPLTALLPPVEWTVVEQEGGRVFKVRKGDEMALRLLRDGYGKVRLVYWRAPSLADVWHLLRATRKP